jgi:ribosomal protein L7Ae-like RNA K-turn-binding protein
MKSKIDSYLGFAKKSGNLIKGMHTCSMAARAGKVKLILITQDTSPGSQKKAVKMANDNNIRYRIYGDSEGLSKVTGNVSGNIFGITDANFADVIIKEIDRNEEVLQ